MKKFVLDTSVFTNNASYRQFGRNAQNALQNFLNEIKSSSGLVVEFYMTPECYTELGHFIDLTKIKGLSKVTIKAPDRDQVQVSGAFVYQLVTDFRKRTENALKYGTSLIRETYSTEPEKREKGQPDPIAPFIKRLRETSRHHTREGFLDSGADFDTLLLAKELGAKVVSSDNGLISYAHRLGVGVLPFNLLKEVVNNAKERVQVKIIPTPLRYEETSPGSKVKLPVYKSSETGREYALPSMFRTEYTPEEKRQIEESMKGTPFENSWKLTDNK